MTQDEPVAPSTVIIYDRILKVTDPINFRFSRPKILMASCYFQMVRKSL